MTTPVVLTGLDGSNPLAFLAALGVLNILADEAESARGTRSETAPKEDPGTLPSLSWKDEGSWRPVVHSDCLSLEDLVDRILRDLQAWKDEPVRMLRYSKGKGEKAKKAKEAWDLKPPPEVFRAFTGRILEACSMYSRRGVDFLASFATETAVDNNGNTKPTTLHFTAGQQEFLRQVDGLISGLNRDDILEALAGPWRYDRPLPVLGWDATNARDHALRADDPSKDKKLGVPGADWLAFRGLPFFRVAAQGSSLLTSACSGGWKDGSFRWPLWSMPLERGTIHTLMTIPGIGGPGPRSAPTALSARDRRLRGIDAVFRCSIRRSDQGGYGSFSAPSRV